MVASPAETKMPKTQEAICSSDSPPEAPTASVTAIGPEAEKIRPIRPLTAYSGLRSRSSCRGPAGERSGRSRTGARCRVDMGLPGGWTADGFRSVHQSRPPGALRWPPTTTGPVGESPVCVARRSQRGQG